MSPDPAVQVGAEPTVIPGLLFVHVPVHRDERGWFKENWRRDTMSAAGLPDFVPVQHNVSFNTEPGVTRGFHAEPWDKLVSVATGAVFGAWVDLREGPQYGATLTREITPDEAVFIPRGVANAFQTLLPNTAYSYLVTAHWSPERVRDYVYVNVADPDLAVRWPIALSQAVLSAADHQHPPLRQVRPIRASSLARPRIAILGANGQLGAALRRRWPQAQALGHAEADVTDPSSLDRLDWRGLDTVINASAYTAVDQAETPPGRRLAWAANVTGVAELVRRCRDHRVRLVHISSDYVFDGAAAEHTEEEPVSPLGVYGQTKAAADAVVCTLAEHYILRTSWLIGQGANFVRTMAALADRGAAAAVVDDQHGRLTFTEDLAAGIAHLLAHDAPSGIYNLTNSGPTHTWKDIAAQVFALRGQPTDMVTPVSTRQYAQGKQLAPRPRHSTLTLGKIAAAGFQPPPAWDALQRYVTSLPPGV